jgi:hypothetical protein
MAGNSGKNAEPRIIQPANIDDIQLFRFYSVRVGLLAAIIPAIRIFPEEPTVIPTCGKYGIILRFFSFDNSG